MKIYLVIPAVLLVLLLCAVTVGAVCLVNTAEDVRFTADVLYGDLSAADGVTVRFGAEYLEHMFWEIVHSPSEPQRTEAAYRFSRKEESLIGGQERLGVTIGTNFEHGFDLSADPSELTGLVKEYTEMYRELKTGESATRDVELKELYPYYPIQTDVSLPGVVWSLHGYETSVGTMSAEQKDRAAFSEFFRIPVPEGVTIRLNMKKNAGGSVSYGSDLEITGELFGVSAVTADRCFFTIGNDFGSGLTDVSLIPGGYGIYSVEYGTPVQNGGTGLRAQTLKNAFPLDLSVRVRRMEISADGERLLALTEGKGGEVALLVVDLNTMTQLQCLSLGPEKEEKMPCYFFGEDFFAAANNDAVRLYTCREDGTYEDAFSVPAQNQVDPAFRHIIYWAEPIYDGERLVFAGQLEKEYWMVPAHGDYWLAVYDKNGLVSYTEYRCSLSLRGRNSAPSAFDCLMDALRLAFEN